MALKLKARALCDLRNQKQETCLPNTASVRVQGRLALQKSPEGSSFQNYLSCPHGKPAFATLILVYQLQREAGVRAEHRSPGSHPAPWPGLQPDTEGDEGAPAGLWKVVKVSSLMIFLFLIFNVAQWLLPKEADKGSGPFWMLDDTFSWG